MAELAIAPTVLMEKVFVTGTVATVSVALLVVREALVAVVTLLVSVVK